MPLGCERLNMAIEITKFEFAQKSIERLDKNNKKI